MTVARTGLALRVGVAGVTAGAVAPLTAVDLARRRSRHRRTRGASRSRATNGHQRSASSAVVASKPKTSRLPIA
jgi:hypothetical protein